MTRSSAVRSTVTSRSDAVRSSTIAYRIPEVFSSFGVSTIYDWREGYAGKISTAVTDPIGGKDLMYIGNTAITSVLGAGRYTADFEASVSDCFRTSKSYRVNSGNAVTKMTLFAWVKRESSSASQSVMARFQNTGSLRSWRFRISNTSKFQIIASASGTASSLQIQTNSSIDDSTTMQFLTFVSDTTSSTLLMYFNGVSQAYNFSLGSGPVNFFDAEIDTWVGAEPSATATPSVSFDGFIGMCGYCVGTAWTAQQVTDFYNMTKSLGGY